MKKSISFLLLLIALACFCVSAICDGAYRTLSVGSYGNDVLAVKNRMKELGYFSGSNLNNRYTDDTAERVRRFEAACGLPQTGVLTPALQALLFSDAAVASGEKKEAATLPDVADSAYRLIDENASGDDVLPNVYCGVLTLITNGNPGMLLSLHFNVGDLFCIASQFAWAFYGLAGRRLSGHIDLVTLLGWCSLVGSAGTILFGLFTGTFQPTELPTVPFLSYLYVTLLGGIACNVFWNIGVKYVGPSVSSVFLNLTPVVGIFCGWLIFGETVGILQLLGAAVIFLGVYLTTHGGDV